MTTDPLFRNAEEIEYEPVSATDGLAKGVLVDEADAPNFALRRFTLAPGAAVPRHTNEIEHVQYVLTGSYLVGIEEDGDDVERRVEPGDAVVIPAGTVHWYRNDGDEEGAFLCAVPHGDDEIELVEAP